MTAVAQIIRKKAISTRVHRQVWRDPDAALGRSPRSADHQRAERSARHCDHADPAIEVESPTDSEHAACARSARVLPHARTGAQPAAGASRRSRGELARSSERLGHPRALPSGTFTQGWPRNALGCCTWVARPAGSLSSARLRKAKKPPLSRGSSSGRDRRRSGDLPLFRRSLCQLSYPTVSPLARRAVPTGFEPATSGLTGQRALQTAPRDLHPAHAGAMRLAESPGIGANRSGRCTPCHC